METLTPEIEDIIDKDSFLELIKDVQLSDENKLAIWCYIDDNGLTTKVITCFLYYLTTPTFFM